ncbi:hypothetical protein [Basilea psittacipulmonis]|uniref:hypothetical protein n=1 Tax=Basilea psittacipulmonis TaxID=1472345 RepID=UPI00130143D2|nr:hypothetical protein [Basilea psittacipulmonis]
MRELCLTNRQPICEKDEKVTLNYQASYWAKRRENHAQLSGFLLGEKDAKITFI